MTAIYACVIKKEQFGIIASDNIIVNTKKRVDKIVLINDRFAIGVFGKDSVIHSLNLINHFQQFHSCQKAKTLDEVLNLVWELAEIICNYQYEYLKKDKEDGKISEKEWTLDIKPATYSLIILDCQEFDLYQVDENRLFSPKDINLNPRVKKLEDKTLHLFSFAMIVARREKENINKNIQLNPLHYFKQRTKNWRLGFSDSQQRIKCKLLFCI